MEVWLARDEDESLYLYYGQKPIKGLYSWFNGTIDYCNIKKSLRQRMNISKTFVST